MSRLHIATRGTSNWRARLGNPEKHWKRTASAMETAVSWESAASRESGLPGPVEAIFCASEFAAPHLLLAVAEHKVRLAGRGGVAQCDVWGLVRTAVGTVSLSVEAKANECFGGADECLGNWLVAKSSAKLNREKRWECIRQHLPSRREGAYDRVAYQLLQRSAAAVIEARRFRLQHAAVVIQSFNCPEKSFNAYAHFCEVVGIPAARGAMHITQAEEIRLGIGWADCPYGTDAQFAKVL
jgi:hypothetical protein